MNKAGYRPWGKLYAQDYLSNPLLQLCSLEEAGLYFFIVCAAMYVGEMGKLDLIPFLHRKSEPKPMTAVSEKELVRILPKIILRNDSKFIRCLKGLLEKKLIVLDGFNLVLQIEYEHALRSERKARGPLQRRLRLKTNAQTNVQSFSESEFESVSECEFESVSVSDSDSEYDSDSYKGGLRGKIPTVDEVRRYCEDNGLTGVDPEDFYSHYERAEWKDRSGQPINNWRRVLETFDKNNRNYESGTGVCREDSKGDKAAGNLLPNQM